MADLSVRWLVNRALLGAGFVLLVVGAIRLVSGTRGPEEYATETARVTVETLAGDLDTPWDLAWGPDDVIWVTERPGRISRVDPETGTVTEVGRIEVLESGESGLMGMAFHPDFANQPFLYVVHSYREGGGIANRLVRMRYDGSKLGEPAVLLDGIAGNRNHDGSRLTFGPDGMLYVTTGDGGRAELAQDLTSLAGKILRVTPDGQAAPANPFDSRIYSLGHRNPQGIVFHPETGALYASEHGPRDNDEVNRIVRGGNHGWPAVHGTCDGDATGEESFCERHDDVVEALATWTPTVGIAGLAYYGADLIPGWHGNLLVTSLRGEAMWRLSLSTDGDSVIGREELFSGEYGRLRAVLVAPDGVVYLATSNRDGRGNPAGEDDRILRIRR